MSWHPAEQKRSEARARGASRGPARPTRPTPRVATARPGRAAFALASALASVWLYLGPGLAQHPAVLTVYAFPAGFGQPSLSPFCTKLMVHLTLAGVAHQVKRGDVQKAPKGKLPYARIGDELIGDSGHVLNRLGAQAELDGELSEQQRAVAHLVRRTLEEHFYWTLVHERWITDEGWAHQQRVLAPMLPPVLRSFLPGVLRRGLRKTLRAHGVGRHGDAEIAEAGVRDLRAAEALASAEGPYFFGPSPSSTDVVVHAFVGGALANQHANPLTDAARALPRLQRVVSATEVEYRARGGKDA